MSAGQVADEFRRRAGFEDKLQLSEKVAAYVREAITVGELRAPEFIRTERLADELGVSATPVREALMILHSERAVRWEFRRGFRVVPITAQDVRDLFDVQAYIAGELAARAVDTLSDGEMDRLADVQRNLEISSRTGKTDLVDDYNHEIHRTINKASGSTRMGMLLSLTVHYVPLHSFGEIEGWAEASMHDHTGIFEALRARDADSARMRMAEHIRHIGRLLTSHLEMRGVLSESSAS